MTTCYAVVKWIKAFQQVFTKSWQGGCAAPPHDAVIRVTQRRGELTGPLINTQQISDIGLEYLSNAYLIQSIFSLKILNFTFSASCNSKLSRRLPIFTCVLEYFIIILVMQYFIYIFSFPKNLSFCTVLSFFGCQGSNGCISSAQSSTSFHRGLSRWIMRTRKQTSKQTSLSQSSHTLFPPAAPPVVQIPFTVKRKEKKTTPNTEARVCLNS